MRLIYFLKFAIEDYAISTAKIKDNIDELYIDNEKSRKLYTDNETILEKDVEASFGFKKKCVSRVDFWLKNFLWVFPSRLLYKFLSLWKLYCLCWCCFFLGVWN